MPDNEITENKVIDKINYKNLIDNINENLNDKEKEVLKLTLKGLTMRDIANKTGVSHQCVHKRMCKIREKIRNIYK